MSTTDTDTDTDTATLRSRLLVLADHFEIRDLLDRYVITLDTHDERQFDDSWYRTIFTEDAQLNFPINSYEGVAGLADFETRSKSNWEQTHHVSSNCAIDLDGDRATVRAQVLATHVHLPSTLVERGNDSHALFTFGGYYDAEVLRTADGWRFRLLTLHVVWHTGEGPPANSDVHGEMRAEP
ncbi:MAG: nuclear transport factor 2 family protein [Sciscionella sp.]